MVDRYDIDLDSITMVKVRDGDFVYHYDYEELAVKYYALVDKLGELWREG